jgi:hypothetical protein
MNPRPRRSGKSARSAFACLVLAPRLLCAGAMASCGSGDDATSAAPGRDAGSVADATTDAGNPVDASLDRALPSTGARDADTGDVGDAGVATAVFSSSAVDVGPVACGSAGMNMLTVTNGGDAALAVSATTTGAAFIVSPSVLSLDAGATGSLTITATIPGSSTAGTPVTGSLDLFTNDPTKPNVSLPLSATPTGATIKFAATSPTQAAFPTTPPGKPATAIAFSFVNAGNAPATIAFGPPSDRQFSLSASSDSGASVALNPGASPLVATAGFTPGPSAAASASATSTITVTGTTCGTGVTSLSFSGAVGHGQLFGWPTPPTGQQTAQIDFGAADCGGGAPPSQFIILTNTGSADAHVTTATITGAPGFSTDALGATIPMGQALIITLLAPSVASLSPLTPVTATLSIQTDVDTSAHAITLTEEPRGAVLTFDTSPTAKFGSFGQVVLLQAASQNFNVVNTGNAAASVALTTTGAGPGPSPFAVSNPSFTVPANGTQTDAVTFSPHAAGPTAGAIALMATGPVCAPLPPPLPLSAFGIGGGPNVVPTSLAFSATCGGGAPSPRTFTVSNKGTANLNWTLSSVTGPGSAQYQISAVPPPGLLAPNASATVTVAPMAIPSPAANPDPSVYAASLTITTDVPFDDDHVVSLTETPLGDQLSLSAASLRFGQFPIATTTLAQTFTVINGANPGSPAANLSFVLAGSGSGSYSLNPAAVSNLGPNGSVSPALGITFEPQSPVVYPATLALATSDALCTPLPSPIRLTGTGTEGKASVSATTLAFGTDTSDASGLVNCGATGPAHTFTVSNVGNEQFNITGLSLGMGASSPYGLSGDAATLPAPVPIGGSATITVTPKAIPAAVPNPNDASPFTDTLTVTTDAAFDAPHTIALVMQARGAVIASTPLAGTWNFGTLGNGSIGTFSNTITNTGNATASIAFQGLQHPTVFGLQSAPTTVAANGVTDVVGQFSPPATNQLWTDQGTLVVTATQALCEPLPSSWNAPTIALSGSSISGSLPVTVAGSLAFPSTNCGNAAPAAQSITLTNTANVPYVFAAQLNSGRFYTLQNPTMGDASAGIIPGNGIVVLGVTPQTVAPGPSAVAGSAPYADDLVVTIQSPTPSGVTIPISWTLDGAMLSLPQGLGPDKDAMGHPFYAADSQSGFALPMDNSGTATAVVQFGLLQPNNAFSVSPPPPISVEPNIPALPRLTSSGSDATCPSLTAGSATFLYSGPVCRPFPYPQVTIQSCVGTL